MRLWLLGITTLKKDHQNDCNRAYWWTNLLAWPAHFKAYGH